MHTFISDGGSWKVHHNGDFKGAIVVAHTIKDGSVVDAVTDMDAILATVRDTHDMLPDYSVVLMARSSVSHKFLSLEVPLQVLRCFVGGRYVRRALEEWLEQVPDDSLLPMLPLVGKLNAGTVLTVK